MLVPAGGRLTMRRNNHRYRDIKGIYGFESLGCINQDLPPKLEP